MRSIYANSTREALLEIPLTANVAVGGAVTILAPVLGPLGALTALLAALLAEFKVAVIYSHRSGEE